MSWRDHIARSYNARTRWRAEIAERYFGRKNTMSLRLTEQEYAELCARISARNDRAAVPAADVERDHAPERARADEAHEVHPRFSIRVHHRSRRLADATGRSHKAAVDGIVRGGILRDDSPAYLTEIRETFEERQNEETVIELWEVQ